jgi:hypothetical protein
VEPERRYALDALLDALGLPFDESVPVEPAVLDEVFGLLTLARSATPSSTSMDGRCRRPTRPGRGSRSLRRASGSSGAGIPAARASWSR